MSARLLLLLVMSAVTLGENAPGAELIPNIPSIYNTFDVSQRIHEDIELKCSALGRPRPSVVWFCNGARLINSKKYYERTEDIGQHRRTSSLRIRSLTLSDYTEYICRANNTYGQARLAISVLMPNIPFFDNTVDKVSQRLNENVELNCSALGRPRPGVVWFCNGVRLINSQKYHERKEDAGRHRRTSYLLIRSLTLSDYTEYICRAKNYYGEASLAIQVLIPNIPSIYNTVTTVSQRLNENVELNCSAFGRPKPTIVWSSSNGFSLINISKYHQRTEDVGRHRKASYLLIRSLSRRDFIQYICSAENVYGQERLAISVTESPKFKLASSSSTSILCETSAVFLCIIVYTLTFYFLH